MPIASIYLRFYFWGYKSTPIGGKGGFGGKVLNIHVESQTPLPIEQHGKVDPMPPEMKNHHIDQKEAHQANHEKSEPALPTTDEGNRDTETGVVYRS